MKLVIVKYKVAESDDFLFDPYIGDEEIPEDYKVAHFAEFHETELQESVIEQAAKEELRNLEFFKMIIEKSVDLKLNLLYMGHDIINHRVFEGEFQKMCIEQARRHVIKDMVESEVLKLKQETKWTC